MGNINARDPYYWNVPDDPGIRNDHWMQHLSGGVRISELSIPGTHNTMAREGVLWAWCQSLSLMLQLLVGIRFLDIRCRHFKNALPIHHEAYYQNADLTDVLSVSINFLTTHPSETILMRIKQEYTAKDNNVTFYESVQAAISRFPRERFWTRNQIPYLRQCRGKIVVIDDFSNGLSGIWWGGSLVNKEDAWKSISKREKWNKVAAHLDEAVGSNISNQLYITFTSFTSGIEAARELAGEMNPKLGNHIHSKRGRFGIIANNYPGPQLISDIINTNSIQSASEMEPSVCSANCSASNEVAAILPHDLAACVYIHLRCVFDFLIQK